MDRARSLYDQQQFFPTDARSARLVQQVRPLVEQILSRLDPSRIERICLKYVPRETNLMNPTFLHGRQATYRFSPSREELMAA
jgi:hypothetical protein